MGDFTNGRTARPPMPTFDKTLMSNKRRPLHCSSSQIQLQLIWLHVYNVWWCWLSEKTFNFQFKWVVGSNPLSDSLNSIWLFTKCHLIAQFIHLWIAEKGSLIIWFFPELTDALNPLYCLVSSVSIYPFLCFVCLFVCLFLSFFLSFVGSFSLSFFLSFFFLPSILSSFLSLIHWHHSEL